MPAITDRDGRRASRGTGWRRLDSFVGLWVASLAVTVVLAHGLRALLWLGGLAG